jgi:hypothetical protein
MIIKKLNILMKWKLIKILNLFSNYIINVR